MAILAFKVSTDARCIYLYGTKKLVDEPAAYVPPIEQYAAENFTQAQIDNAKEQGWITEDEYAATMTFVHPAAV